MAPRRDITLLELTALGIATSLIVVQGVTIAAIVLHQPIGMMLTVLACDRAGACGGDYSPAEVVVRFPRSEWVLASALAIVAACLYVAGSPYGSTEDAIHIAIVRRLRFLGTPALDNVYVVPNVVYTYPFPGTHYLMAAISRLADLDPLFVYSQAASAVGPCRTHAAVCVCEVRLREPGHGAGVGAGRASCWWQTAALPVCRISTGVSLRRTAMRRMWPWACCSRRYSSSCCMSFARTRLVRRRVS